VPQIGGFQRFHTARRTIQGFEAMLWLHKGFGFACTVREQIRLCRSASVSRRLINRLALSKDDAGTIDDTAEMLRALTTTMEAPTR